MIQLSLKESNNLRTYSERERNVQFGINHKTVNFQDKTGENKTMESTK